MFSASPIHFTLTFTLPTAADLAAAPDPAGLVHGTLADRSEVPAAGAILVGANFVGEDGHDLQTTAFTCSSILIAPDVVLTAAHCVDIEMLEAAGIEDVQLWWSREPDLFDYAIGLELDEALPDPPSDAIAVDAVVVHPEFDETRANAPLGQVYDLGLMFLATPVTDVQPAYVPRAEPGDGVVSDLLATVVGWGQAFAEIPEAGTDFAGVKRTGVSPIGEVGEFEFVVGTHESDPRQCNGDSGGPIVLEEPTGETRVVGIASRLPDATLCETHGAINTRVLAYREWIEGQMIAACEDGRRTACDEPGLAVPGGPDDDDTNTDDDTDTDDDAHAGCAIGPRRSPSAWLLVLGLAAGWRRRRLTPRSR